MGRQSGPSEKFRELASTARVLHAMEPLANGEHRVTDVALAVGFDSLSAFAKSFARVASESPSAYRTRCRSGFAGAGSMRAPLEPRNPAQWPSALATWGS